MTLHSPVLARIVLRCTQGLSIFFVGAILTLLFLLALANYYLVSMEKRLTPMITQELRQTLGRDVHIGTAKLQGWNSVVITDAQIAEGATFAQGTALSAPQATARVNLLALAMRRGQNPAGAISQIIVKRPTLSVSRSREGRWDFQDIVDRVQQQKAKNAMHTQLIVEDGRVDYHDAHGFGGAATTIDQQMVGISGRLTPTSATGYQFDVSAVDRAHRIGRVRVAGHYSSRSGAANLNLTANRIAVTEVSRYLPKNLPITFADGTAALRLSALLQSLPNPKAVKTMPITALTADIDLTGVGLRLQEMSTPVMATDGHLRLVHDASRYPKGSRLDLIGVHAKAGELPVEIGGTISDINLLDLAHMNPQFNVQVSTVAKNGATISKLFPDTKWLQSLSIDGPVALTARATGRPKQLRIQGIVRGDRFHTGEFSGENGEVRFTLQPGADTTRGQRTLAATASLQRARVGDATFENIQTSLTSTTPWRSIDDALQLSGSVKAGTLKLPWAEATKLTSTVTATRGQISLSQLRAELFGGTVTGRIDLPLNSQRWPDRGVQGTATYARVDLARVADALHLGVRLSGIGSGALTVHVAPDGALTLDSDITAGNVRYGDYIASTATATVHSVTENGATTVAIPHATAQTDHGIFTITDGQFQRGGALPGNGSLNLPIVGERIPLARYAKEISGTATLHGTVTGNLNAPALTASLTAVDGMVLDRTYATATGEMTAQGTSLRMRNMTLSRPGMTMAIPGGAEGFDPRDGFRDVSATVTLSGAPVQEVLDLVPLKCPWRIDGGTYGTVSLQTTDKGVVASGAVTVNDAVVYLPQAGGDYPLPLDKLALDFDYADHIAQVRQLTMVGGKSTVVAQGSVTCPAGGSPDADLTFSSSQALVEDMPQRYLRIPLTLSGTADVQGTLRGELSGTGATPLEVNVKATSPQLTAEGVPVGSGDIDFSYRYRPDDRQFIIHQSSIATPAFHATSSGDYLLSRGEMRGAKAQLSQVDLLALRAMLGNPAAEGKFAMIGELLQSYQQQLSGQGTVNLTAEGRFRQPEVALDVDFSRLMLGKTPLPDLHANLETEAVGKRYGLRIREAVLTSAGNGQAHVSGRITPDGRLDLNFGARDLTTKLFSPWMGDTLPPVDGRLSLDGSVTGPWKTPVVESDVRVEHPRYADYAMDGLQGHIRLTHDALTLSDGLVQMRANSRPLQVDGMVPLQWQGLRVEFPVDRPLALAVVLPQQDLAFLRTFLPDMPDIQGVIEGRMRVGGTMVEPRITSGNFNIAGNATLPKMDGAYPNRINNIDLRVQVADEGSGSRVRIEKMSALLDRTDKNGKRVAGFNPGLVAAEGTVTIGREDLLTPDNWDWDVYARAARIPLSSKLFLVPNISGFLRVTSESGAPVINGVLATANSKIKEPKLDPKSPPHWGPFSFNPKLSIVLQVGERVTISKSIVRLPLRMTPLPWVLAAEPAGVQPSLDIDRGNPAYGYSAAMLNPGTSAELPGSWGAVMGSFENPQIYARFEVDKKRLSFPFNLIGSISKARGHVTFSLAEGPRITMGIPDFPQAPAPAKASTGTTVDAPKEASAGKPVVTPGNAEKPASKSETATREVSSQTPPAAVPAPAQ